MKISKGMYMCLVCILFFSFLPCCTDRNESTEKDAGDISLEDKDLSFEQEAFDSQDEGEDENVAYRVPRGFEMLIPYEMNGKIGFINPARNVVFEAEYDYLLEESRYIMMVKKLGPDSSDAMNYILLGNGEKIPIDKASVIKDGFYCIEYRIGSREFKSVLYRLDKSVQLELENISIYNGSQSMFMEIVNPYDKNSSRLDYIDRFGRFYFPGNTFKRIYDFSEDGLVAVVMDENFDSRIIDREGNYVSDKIWWRLDTFSNGLALGGREGEQGFFDMAGNLIISTKIVRELPMHFHCERMPCIIENNEIIITDKDYFSENWAIIDTKGNHIKEGIHANYIHEFSDDGTAVM